MYVRLLQEWFKAGEKQQIIWTAGVAQQASDATTPGKRGAYLPDQNARSGCVAEDQERSGADIKAKGAGRQPSRYR